VTPNAYDLLAAARGDAERLCAMRTRGALRELGGRAACERQPTGIEVFHHRRLSGTDLAAAEVRPGDTSGRGITARVVADYGQAVLDSGHAVAGKIHEVDLRMEGGRYKISRVGAAVFVAYPRLPTEVHQGAHAAPRCLPRSGRRALMPST